MKRPLTGLVVVYAAGIWIESLVRLPFAPLCWIVAATFSLYLLLHRTRFSLVPLLTLVTTTGMITYWQATTISSTDHITRLLDRRDQNVELRGVIVSDPGFGEGRTNDDAAARHRFNFDLRALKINGEWQEAQGRLLVTVGEAHEPMTLRYGDEIECSALLRVPQPALNPGAFDWQQWLERQRIFFTATIRKMDYCDVIARDQGHWISAVSLHLRDRFEHALRVGLDKEPEVAGALTAMVIGERSEIAPDTYADFQRTGVFHVFAINGLHVGLVTAVVLVFLLLLRLPRRWSALIAIPILILYVFATGAHPGAVRALIMACVWLTGGMLLRPVELLNSLAAAALIILVYDPTQLFDGGFILSFTVVVALVTLVPGKTFWKRIVYPDPSLPHVERWWMSLARPDPFLPRRLVPRWRMTMVDCVVWMLQFLRASAAAWIGLLPLLAVYFHLFTPVSIVANLLVIPLLGGVIALGLLSTLAYPICPWLTLMFNNANYFLLNVMMRGVDWLGHVPWGHAYVQAPPLWLVWVYYGLGIILLARTVSWQWRRRLALLAVPAVGAVVFVMGWRDEAVELTVLDLTDGACMFLNLPGERHDMLLDGGGDWSGARVVVPYLRAQGVDRLGQVVVTHGDKAHVAGLPAVANELPIDQMLHAGTASRSKYFVQWMEQAHRQGIPVRTLRAGDELSIGGVGRLRVLNPPDPSLSKRGDDNSLALAIESGPTRVLLMADTGETVERRLLKEARDLRAQLIVKGRHSTESSCTDAFLDAVQPDAVVVAASVRPIERYPEPELRERLQRRGVRLIRTDEAGAVTIRLTKRGYTIATTRD